MKKILFAIIAILAINACNSPQKMTSPTGDSMINNMDSSNVMKKDSI